MKTRKFTKLVSFILALTIVITSSLVCSLKVSAAVTSVETQCLRCDATLGWSGPFLGSVPTPNDSTFEGAYVVDSDRDEWHYYIIKCPDFKSTLLGKKHDYYPAIEKHNYTSSYTQYDSSRHTRTYTCTKNNAAYNIVGTAGCGYSKDVLEAHTVSWQRRCYAEDDYHLLQSMCICGYVVSEVKEPHTFEAEKTYNYSMTQHHKTKFCTVCQDTIHIYENHNFDIFGEWKPFGTTECKRIVTCSDCNYEQEEIKKHSYTYGEWTKSSSTQCKRTKTCSDCKYSTTEYQNHDMIKGEWFKYGSENSYDDSYSHLKYHQRDSVCAYCGYTESEHAEHEMLLKSDWHPIDDSWHSMTKECSACFFTAGYEAHHHFTNTGTHTYEKLDNTQHTVYMPCDECGYVKAETDSHNLIYGDWSDNGDGSCSRTISCSECGYAIDESQTHNFTYSDWDWDNDDSDKGATHKRTKTCSLCSYQETEAESHDDYWVWLEDTWTPSGNDGCTRSRKCSVCGKSVYIYTKHQFSSLKDYVCISDTQHEYTRICTLCDTQQTAVKNHSYPSSAYEPYSETQHKFTQTCDCGYAKISYYNHRDNNRDLYCDDCGYNMTRFSVTLPTTMNFVMSKTGEVYTADTTRIFNNSTAAVSIKQVRLETVNGWSLTKFDEKAIASSKVDSKQIGFKLKKAETSETGQTETFNFTDWSISKGVYQTFTYDAVISATSTPIENEQIMNVIFIVDWKE